MRRRDRRALGEGALHVVAGGFEVERGEGGAPEAERVVVVARGRGDGGSDEGRREERVARVEAPADPGARVVVEVGDDGVAGVDRVKPMCEAHRVLAARVGHDAELVAVGADEEALEP